jgi:hypothetical protein
MRCHRAQILSAIFIILGLAGCAATDSGSESSGANFKSRAKSATKGAVTVSASVLSADESAKLYGAPLADAGIQPVWIEVENNDDAVYWLMSPGVDPNFFPASEAAEAFGGAGSNGALRQRFEELAFRNPVAPRTTSSGLVLTNIQEGVKMVQVDLVATGRLLDFSFMSLVPGFRADYQSRGVLDQSPYPPDQIADYTDDEAFRAALRSLPCCVTNSEGTRNGDPLNLVVVGGLEDAFPALVRRGWQPTEETWFGSVMKMVTSTLMAERYPYAPVSPLYLYGRPQDLALQRARDTIHQRNHMRLWLSPMRHHGKAVWIGQISRDIGSRLTIHSPYLTTHKIDPDVDEVRTALLEDMAYSQNLSAIGFVDGVGAASKEEPRGNLTTDPYYTDGYRAVLIFDSRPRSIAEIELLPWARRERQLVPDSGQVSPPS